MAATVADARAQVRNQLVFGRATFLSLFHSLLHAITTSSVLSTSVVWSSIWQPNCCINTATGCSNRPVVIGTSTVNPLRRKVPGAFFCNPLARAFACRTRACFLLAAWFPVFDRCLYGQASNTQKHWWSDTFEITMVQVGYCGYMVYYFIWYFLSIDMCLVVYWYQPVDQCVRIIHPLQLDFAVLFVTRDIDIALYCSTISFLFVLKNAF